MHTSIIVMFGSPSVHRLEPETPLSSYLDIQVLHISSNGIPIEARHCCDRRSQGARCKLTRSLCISLCLTMQISWNGFDNSAKIPTTSSLLLSAIPTPLRNSHPFSGRKSLRSRAMSSTLIRFRYAQFPHVASLPSATNLLHSALWRISPRLEAERSTG